jgi:hypothetical protein
MSNKTALMSCTKDSIWPSYKFLFFRGRWNVYDTRAHKRMGCVSIILGYPPFDFVRRKI